ncbi:sigma-E factor regulatory protein RseB domain-containing protein, partial [Pseudoalteromonas ruthenica]|uniref:sigma-E factor regulatory protein RseB domain-containing protein n=1 Tax=Pseudoalteromonas ruthenica TaxID=151081 RepID=UPI00127AF201
NFVASFVGVKDRAMEADRWSHGSYKELEVELLTLLSGDGLEMVRFDDQFKPQIQPYSIATNTIAGPIPEVLLSDIANLQSNYRFVLGN